MPDEKKLDAFKPQQPNIPGVAPTPPLSEDAIPSEELSSPPRGDAATAVWIAVVVVGVFLIIGFLFYRSLRVAAKPATASLAPDSSTPTTVPSQPAPDVLAGPGVVATAQELAKPWSSKRFMFHGHVALAPDPAMVVRLPGGQYWGFSLREPYGTCELEYLTDLRKIANDYHFRATHPMVGNPCTHTIYDLMQYGGGSGDDGLVRGLIVSGTGIRPPMAIEIRTEGNNILAVRME
jgi:hypothetical protein